MCGKLHIHIIFVGYEPCFYPRTRFPEPHQVFVVSKLRQFDLYIMNMSEKHHGWKFKVHMNVILFLSDHILSKIKLL